MTLAAAGYPGFVDHALIVISLVCGVVFVGIIVAMVLFSVKYRRSRARKVARIEGHTGLEVAWVVIPTAIFIWMFFIGYRGFEELRDVPDDALVVEVTGQQWSWSFSYPEEGITSTELVLPIGRAVKFSLTAPASDVLHSFYVPGLRVKEDLVPGRVTHLGIKPDQLGEYDIFCAEFCGAGHSKMMSLLRVVSPADFDGWVKKQRDKRLRPLEYEALIDPDLAAFGKDDLNIDANALFETYCVSCHGEKGDGSGLPGVARNFTSAEGWTRGTKVSDIYRTLTEGVEGTQMRPFPNLTMWEKVALAHHVRAFVPGKLPTDTKEDFAELVRDYGVDKTQPETETLPIDRAMELLVEEAAEKKGAQR